MVDIDCFCNYCVIILVAILAKYVQIINGHVATIWDNAPIYLNLLKLGNLLPYIPLFCKMNHQLTHNIFAR
jgi:hypothetical protein